MGLMDLFSNLLSSNTAQPQQQSSGAASSSTAAAKQPTAEQPAAQPLAAEANAVVNNAVEPQISAERQKLFTAMEVIAPAMVTKEVKASDEKRAERLKVNMQNLNEASSVFSSEYLTNLEQLKGAGDLVVDRNALFELAQMDQLESVDTKMIAKTAAYDKMIDNIDVGLQEDTQDLADARALQQTGNPLKWLWGKIKEEYNNETIKEGMVQKAGLQQQKTVDFANMSAERQLNNKKMIDAKKLQIYSNAMYQKLAGRETLTAKQLEHIGKQFDLSAKEIGEIYQSMQIDLSKQQLTMQSAALKIQQAQETRQASQWTKTLEGITDKEQAAKDSWDAAKKLNQTGGFTWSQWKDAYINERQVNGPVVAHINALFNVTTNDIAAKTGGASNIKITDVDNLRAAGGASPFTAKLLQAKEDAINDPAMQELQKTTAMYGAAGKAQYDEVLNKKFQENVQATLQNGQALVKDGDVVIPTIKTWVDSGQTTIKIENQKAFDALKTLQTTFSDSSANNSNFIQKVADVAEANNIPPNVMAKQMSSYYQQIVAEHTRLGKLVGNPTKFMLNLSDDFTGSYNGLSGTYSARRGNIDIFDVRSLSNALMAAQTRKRALAAMEETRKRAVAAMEASRTMTPSSATSQGPANKLSSFLNIKDY